MVSARTFMFVEKYNALLNLLPPVLSMASENDESAKLTLDNFRKS